MSDTGLNNIDTTTILASLPLKFLDVVLAERFLLPTDSLMRFGIPIPETVHDVVEATGMPYSKVRDILIECIELDRLVWLPTRLDHLTLGDGDWLVDMRVNVDFDAAPLHPEARIFHHGDKRAQLEIMRSLNRVIIMSDKMSHAWSAALSLRLMGVKAFLLPEP